MKIRIALGALSSLPLAAFALVLAFAGYASAVIGHWPYYAHPDPKDLPVPILLDICAVVVLGAMVSVFIYPVLAATLFVIAKCRGIVVDRGHRRHALIFGMGVALWVGESLIRGKGCLISWLLD